MFARLFEFAKLFRPASEAVIADRLYVAVMQHARLETFYVDFEAPDTFEGRFEMAALVSILVIRRLQEGDAGARDLAQRLFDRLFAGFDEALRDVGVGDMTIAKRIRKLGEAFYGRAAVYGAALAAGDAPGLGAALARNVWRADLQEAPRAGALAVYALGVAAALADQDLAALGRGEIALPPPGAPGLAAAGAAAGAAR